MSQGMRTCSSSQASEDQPPQHPLSETRQELSHVLATRIRRHTRRPSISSSSTASPMTCKNPKIQM